MKWMILNENVNNEISSKRTRKSRPTNYQPWKEFSKHFKYQPCPQKALEHSFWRCLWKLLPKKKNQKLKSSHCSDTPWYPIVGQQSPHRLLWGLLLQWPTLLQPQAFLPPPRLWEKPLDNPSFGELLRKAKPPMLLTNSQWCGWLRKHSFCNPAVQHQVSCVIPPYILLAPKCRQVHIVHVNTQLSQRPWILRHNSSPCLCYKDGEIEGSPS